MFPTLLVEALIALLIVGVILWGISQILMDPTIARIIRVVVIVFVAIWLIYLLASLLPGAGMSLRR